MIFETLVLGSVLYIGYKELKNGFNKDKLFLPTNGGDRKEAQSVITQLDDNNKKVSQPENNREMVSAAIALTLSTLGLSYHFISPLSLPFILYASKDVYKTALNQSKQGKINVSTLMTITIIGIIIMGRFFIASLVIFLIELALRANSKMAETSKKQLFEVLKQPIDFVWVIVNGVEVRIPFNDLQIDDIVIVRAGEFIPADGTVIKGLASVDQQILTGKTNPIEISPGDKVFASTMILSGKINFKVEKIGEESTIAKITQLLSHTIDFKSTTQLRAEMFSEHLVKPVMIAGGFALPMLGFGSALAVLNAHPKNHVMILAPLSIMNHLHLASQQGIFIKDGRCLELLAQVDTLVFDKTGTLTEEQPQVGAIHCCSHYSEHQVLAYAAAAEYQQTHPVARAIQQEAENLQLERPPIDESIYKIGYGLIVTVAGKTIHIGSNRFMEAERILIPHHIKQQQQLSHAKGHTLILIAVDNNMIGAIELLPTVRSQAKKIISQLKQRPNIKSTYIISGDHEIPTKKLAQELGIDYYFAEILPANKTAIIEQLQQQGQTICYVSDSITDLLALNHSQISISLPGVSTIATETAEFVFMDQGLTDLNLLFELADDFNANINTTFGILLIPTVVGISGAFLFGFGVAHTVALNMTGLAFGLGNTMWPLLKPMKNQPFEEQLDTELENSKYLT